jgi:Type II/IV secretion system protein
MQCRQESLVGTGEIKLRRLVEEALRMRPSRIIVGEVRQEEGSRLRIAIARRAASAGEWLARIDHPRARGLSGLREKLLAVNK